MALTKINELARSQSARYTSIGLRATFRRVHAIADLLPAPERIQTGSFRAAGHRPTLMGRRRPTPA